MERGIEGDANARYKMTLGLKKIIAKNSIATGYVLSCRPGRFIQNLMEQLVESDTYLFIVD